MIFFILFLLMIKEISSSDICSDRCSTCIEYPDHEYDEDYDNCATCQDGLHLLEGTVNCYYFDELPNAYLDSTDSIFKICSSEDNCYECIDYPSFCLSKIVVKKV